MARRPGRKRKLDAIRRRAREPVGPTPEMARRRLAEAGVIGPQEAFGAGTLGIDALRSLLARTAELVAIQLQAAGRDAAHATAVAMATLTGRSPLAPTPELVAQAVAEAEAIRLDDKTVLRRWWETRPSVDQECPLDVLEAAGLIDEQQRAAGMRYGRLVWRIAGLPFHPVERLYRRVGAVEDDHKGVDPDEEDDQRAEKALQDATLAVQTMAPRGGMEVLGQVAVYFQPPWGAGACASVIEGDARFQRLRSALTALIVGWGWRR